MDEMNEIDDKVLTNDQLISMVKEDKIPLLFVEVNLG